MCTFVNDPQKPITKVTPEEQAALNNGLIAVGFYVDINTYKRYQQLARILYKDKAQDEQGRVVPAIPRANPNEMVKFATEFFEQHYNTMQEMSKQAGGPEAFVKQVLGNLAQAGMKL